MTKRVQTVPCPIGCGRNHSPQFLLCRPCWAMCPKELQLAVYEGHRNSAERWKVASDAAIDLVKAKRAKRGLKLQNQSGSV